MAGWSDAVENAILNCYLRGTNITAPANRFLAIYSSSPTDAGGGTELSGNGYARVDVTSSFGNPAASGALSNSVVIDFATASGNWAAGTAVGLFDASTNGNLLAWTTHALDALTANQFHRIAIGDLDFTCD
jgi:hypothetical protein